MGTNMKQGIGTRWLLSDIAATAHCSAETHQPIFHIAYSTRLGDDLNTGRFQPLPWLRRCQITLRPNWDPNYTPTCNYITIASMLRSTGRLLLAVNRSYAPPAPTCVALCAVFTLHITIYISMLHLCLISTCRSRWCRKQNRAQLSVTASSRRALAESSCPRPRPTSDQRVSYLVAPSY